MGETYLPTEMEDGKFQTNLSYISQPDSKGQKKQTKPASSLMVQCLQMGGSQIDHLRKPGLLTINRSQEVYRKVTFPTTDTMQVSRCVVICTSNNCTPCDLLKSLFLLVSSSDVYGPCPSNSLNESKVNSQD